MPDQRSWNRKQGLDRLEQKREMVIPLLDSDSDAQIPAQKTDTSPVSQPDSISTASSVGPAPLSGRQKGLISMLCLAIFSSTVIFSCIAPFFPDEAAKKGIDQTTIGLIFSSFELVMFLTAPIYGRFMDEIGPKLLYCAGLLVCALSIILFAFVTLAPNAHYFLGFCFPIRIMESAGDAAFTTASFSITTREFPARVGTFIGFLETAKGLGYMAGPLIGGILYELGGFQLPFLVLGLSLVLIFLASLAVIPTQPKDDPKGPKENSGILRLLGMPITLFFCSIVTIYTLCFTFLLPTLQGHLHKLELTPMMICIMFMLTAGPYAICAPLWGYVSDRTKMVREMIIFGAVTSAVALVLIGPSPLLGLPRSTGLQVISQLLLGLGASTVYIPTFKNMLSIAKNAGYPDSFETVGTVAGIFHGANCLGAFLGPTLGSAGQAAYGFEWTATILAAVAATIGLSLSVFQCYNHCGEKRTKDWKPLSNSAD